MFTGLSLLETCEDDIPEATIVDEQRQDKISTIVKQSAWCV